MNATEFVRFISDVRSTWKTRGTLAAQGFRAVTAERPDSKEVDMSTSGLTPDEAREFHDYYSKGLISFVIVAVIAHLLTWIWRPWFKGSTASADLLQPLQTLIG